MDAFYASVELLRYPQLQGLPVVIGGSRRNPSAQAPQALDDFARLRDYAGRGVITTATYPARALGVHSGMGLMKAAALAPDAILLPMDFEAYRHHSRQFKAAVVAIAPVMEDRGIDDVQAVEPVHLHRSRIHHGQCDRAHLARARRMIGGLAIARVLLGAGLAGLAFGLIGDQQDRGLAPAQQVGEMAVQRRPPKIGTMNE